MEERENNCVTCGRSLARQRERHRLSRQDLEARPGFVEYVLDHLRIQQVSNIQKVNICLFYNVKNTYHFAILFLKYLRIFLSIPIKIDMNKAVYSNEVTFLHLFLDYVFVESSFIVFSVSLCRAIVANSQ